MQDFDLCVIGAGPAGYIGAIRAAQLGAKVCLIEQAELGGVCLNRGCIPTKTLTNLVDLLERAQEFRRFGIGFPGDVGVDLDAVMRRKRDVVATMVKGVGALLARRGVVVIHGRARFVGEKAIEVRGADGTQEVLTRKTLVATGSGPAQLAGLPFDGSTIISSDEALELAEVPQSILIVGAGSMGCEFAFIFGGLGASVTVVEILDRALPREDRDISAVMERELKKRRVDLITSDTAISSSKNGSAVKCTLRSGREIEATKVLVSVGRNLNTEDLGLEEAGVKCGGKGEIVVNEYMETSAPGIYAAGDVVGTKMLAHSGSREAIVAVGNALGQKKAMDYSSVPSCVFTKPEVGSVGMTQKEASDKGFQVRTGIFNFRALGKAHAIGEISGMVKIVADARTDVVLGVHIIGPHASELVHEGAVAVGQRLTARALGETIHAHPTLSEAVMEAADSVHGLSIHSL